MENPIKWFATLVEQLYVVDRPTHDVSSVEDVLKSQEFLNRNDFQLGLFFSRLSAQHANTLLQ